MTPPYFAVMKHHLPSFSSSNFSTNTLVRQFKKHFKVPIFACVPQPKMSEKGRTQRQNNVTWNFIIFMFSTPTHSSDSSRLTWRFGGSRKWDIDCVDQPHAAASRRSYLVCCGSIAEAAAPGLQATKKGHRGKPHTGLHCMANPPSVHNGLAFLQVEASKSGWLHNV